MSFNLVRSLPYWHVLSLINHVFTLYQYKQHCIPSDVSGLTCIVVVAAVVVDDGVFGFGVEGVGAIGPFKMS